MKKEYIKPSMEAVVIGACQQLLAGSPVPGFGGGGNAIPEAPEFDEMQELISENKCQGFSRENLAFSR